MNVNRYITASFFLVIIISCKESSSKNIAQLREKLISQNKMEISESNALLYDSLVKPIKIKVPELPPEALHYSSILDSITFIPLETNKESLFGDINELVVSKEYIFILDKAQKKVICFDKKGAFRFIINSIGRGPKEYVSLTDMFIDDGTRKLHLLDDSQNKILTYDFAGAYLNEEIIDFVTPFQNFGVLKNRYLIDFNNRLVPGMFPELEYDLILVDIDGKIKSRNLSYNNLYNSYQYKHPTSFLQYKNTLQYISFLKQSVYSISDSKIANRYYVDFGDDQVKEEDLKEFDNYKPQNSKEFKEMTKKISLKLGKYSMGPVDFLESDNHVVFSYYNKGNRFRGIYNKTTTKTMSDAQAIYDHPLGSLLRFALPMAVNEDHFYGVLYPKSILNYHKTLIKNMDEINLEKYYEQFPEYHSLIRRFEENENANPYISIIKFKNVY